jgi:hypothetical protein
MSPTINPDLSPFENEPNTTYRYLLLSPPMFTGAFFHPLGTPFYLLHKLLHFLSPPPSFFPPCCSFPCLEKFNTPLTPVFFSNFFRFPYNPSSASKYYILKISYLKLSHLNFLGSHVAELLTSKGSVSENSRHIIRYTRHRRRLCIPRWEATSQTLLGSESFS